MKAIFPYLGNLILPKTDIEKLKEVYNANLNEKFNMDSCICENGIFNYFKDNSFFIYDQTTRASISELKSALGIGKQVQSNSVSKNSKSNLKTNSNKKAKEQLYDDDIMSNSFFTTLKML